MTDRGTSSAASRRGAFQRRLGLIFGWLLLAVAAVCLAGMYGVLPLALVLMLVLAAIVLAWLAARRLWRPVNALARVVDGWDERQPDLAALQPGHLQAHADADVATLAQGLHAFASRIAGYNQRERHFTRDASHELRSPLTVIKMSTDMLSDDAGLGDNGRRSLERIRRATRELESVVEALLILARESDNGQGEHDFIVNDVLRRALDDAREGLRNHAVTVQLEEQARFAVHGSPRVFAVLCGQLVRHAGQHAGRQGRVVVSVAPGAVSVSSQGAEADRVAVGGEPGAGLAIAQRISERFAWPLDWPAREGAGRTVRIRFPRTLPVSG